MSQAEMLDVIVTEAVEAAYAESGALIALSTPNITDHAFEPSRSYPKGEGCAFIVEGAQWTISDPIRCRRPAKEHAIKAVARGADAGGKV